MRYIILIFIISITACKKYLSQKPDAIQAVPTTLDDLQALLDNSQYLNQQSTPSFMEASSDDYFLTEKTYQSLYKEAQLLYTWQMLPYKYGNDWSKGYLPVYTANFCLEGLSKLTEAERSSASGKQVEGSARFFRAYYFLELLWQHAKAYDAETSTTDLGIPLRFATDPNIPSVRENVENGYRQVIADASLAVDLLPDLPQVTVMRPSRVAAYGLLARVYLSMRKYDSAGYYANKALEIKNDLLDYNVETPVRFHKETIFYTEMNQILYIHMAYMSVIDTVITGSYQPGDLRLKKGFTANGGFYMFNGNYTGDPYILFSGIATDEMLLIRAESKCRTGDIEGAMEDINELLKKRWDNTIPFIPVTANTPGQALQIILLERRKELLMRGLRWMDVKRLNKEGVNIILERKTGRDIITLRPNAGTYALPLPQDIIDQTGMPQN